MLFSNSFVHKKFRKLLGSLLFGVGWILSPMTWWNDSVVNLPLAWLVSSLFVPRDQDAFGLYFVFFYWVTNLAGLVLMYFGWRVFSLKKPISKREILISFLISLGYTAVILILVKLGVLRPL